MRAVIHGQQTEAMKHVTALVQLDDIKLACFPFTIAGRASQSIIANAAVLETASRRDKPLNQCMLMHRNE